MYAEYIYYRKEGDHGTDMPSSIYYGKNKGNRFSISDNIKYKYDESGNISEVRENGLLTVKYTYDKIGRLVREDNRKFGKSVFISYDNCGNILTKRETQFTLKPTDETEVFTSEKLYEYDGDKLIAFGDETVHYGNVNPEIYRGHVLSWNFGKQLSMFGENSFAYDGYGRRIRKNNTVYTYDANNKLVKQSDGSNTLEFVYDNNGLSGVKLAKVVGDKVEVFEYIYSKDVQGNIVGILDKNGNVVVQYNYDAWGSCKVSDVDGNEITSATHVGNLNPFRYRSYYYDRETNLYYLNTRYYDPETGRFISQDDVSYLDPEHINGLNLFAYCGNNPVMGYDPDGTFALSTFLIGCLITVLVCTIVGAAVGGASAAVHGENVWKGAGNGALFGLFSGLSIALVATGVGTPLAGSILGAAVIGAGVGSFVGLNMTMNAQLQGGKGIGSVDMKSVASAWMVGAVVGGIAGAAGHGLAQIGAVYGNVFGSMLADKFFLGIKISTVISQSILAKVGGFAGSFIGGFVGGKLVNYFAQETGMQNHNVPMWLVSIFKFIGKSLGFA